MVATSSTSMIGAATTLLAYTERLFSVNLRHVLVLAISPVFNGVERCNVSGEACTYVRIPTSPCILESYGIQTHLWKVMQKSRNLIPVVESHGKVMEFKRLPTVQFHTVVYFFQIRTLKFTKFMIFMQQLQYNASNLMHVFQKCCTSDIPMPL